MSGPKDAATCASTSSPKTDSQEHHRHPRKRGHDTRRTHRIKCSNGSHGDVFIQHHPGLGPDPRRRRTDAPDLESHMMRFGPSFEAAKSLDLRSASLQNLVMKASSAAAAALSAVIGVDTDLRSLPPEDANRMLERIANLSLSLSLWMILIWCEWSGLLIVD